MGDLLSYRWKKYEVNPAQQPNKLIVEKKTSPLVEQQMKSKAILSYLFFENGQILIDELSPTDRRFR